MFFNAIIYAFVGFVFIFFAGNIVGFFTTEPSVFAYGTNCLRIVAYSFVFCGLGMVIETAFNGAGDTFTPTYLNLFVFRLFEIPLAYLPAYHFDLGPNGVFLAITVAFSVLAVVSALIFKPGNRKRRKFKRLNHKVTQKNTKFNIS